MLRRLLVAFLIIFAPQQALAQGLVSAAEPRATKAGREILRAGGNAIDAAVATMIALTVVEPQSSGIGGGGFLVYHDNATGMIHTIDGRETAPAAANSNRFISTDGKPMPFSVAVPGGLSVGVPGNIALMARAHQRWGRLPWPRLFEPAIRLAEGFTLSKRAADLIAQREELWADFPEARAAFWKDGRPMRAGERARLPELARTLRRIAAEGPGEFYRGETASEIAEAVPEAKRNPATITLADLASYKAKDRPAVCSHYRRFKVCGMGPPSSGGIAVIQILELVERFDLKSMGPRDPRSWHVIAEAMKLAYADREKWVGDRDFVPVPVAGLIDPAYLARRSAMISLNRPIGKYDAGTPPGAEPRSKALDTEVAGTSHFVVIDNGGNVVSMTSTIEGIFGSQLMAGGFFLNNELTDFSFAPEKEGAPVANRVEPGKRPRSSMSPTIVFDETGKPVLALGSAGGPRIIMHVAKTLIGWIDFNLPVSDAIALPNIFLSGSTTLVEHGTFLDEMAAQLSRINGEVRSADLPSKVNAAERTPAGWRGAADPRSDGVALAE